MEKGCLLAVAAIFAVVFSVQVHAERVKGRTGELPINVVTETDDDATGPTTEPVKSPAKFAECSSYMWLNDSTRAKSYQNIGKFLCDNVLAVAWYRFGGKAGNQMPESCVLMTHCGTVLPGWLNGTHPVVADGVVQRNVCFHNQPNCCAFSINISVRSCEGFYVYKLKNTFLCNLRYCGNGLPNAPATKALPVTPHPTVPAAKALPVTSHPTVPAVKALPVTSQPTVPGIPDISINASKSVVNLGGRIEICCFVIGGLDNLNITWYNISLYDGMRKRLIGQSHRTKVDTRGRHLRLTIRNAMIEDAGSYYCNIGYVESRTVSISVLPVIEVQPRAVTKRVGDQVTFNCSVIGDFTNFNQVNLSIVEVTHKDNEVFYNKASLAVTNLQVPEGRKNHVRKFVCELRSRQDGEASLRSEVAKLIIVSSDALECTPELLHGVQWSATVAGGTDLKPCPIGARGTTSRKCSEKGTWTNANFTACSSAEFNKLADMMEAIMEGFQSDVNAQQVLEMLSNATQPIKNSSVRPPQIYGGDLVIAVDILVQIAEYNGNQGNVSSTKDFEKYAQVTSNLLEPVNSRTWKELGEAGQARSQMVVKAMDDYGLGVAATFNRSTKWKSVQTKSLKMRIDRVDQDSSIRVLGLKVVHKQSSINLPPEAFNSSQDSRVVTIVYLTLSEVLSLAKENGDEDYQGFSANTSIVSSSVYPKPPLVLNKPVKVVLQNRKKDIQPSGTPKGKCVFWRPEESAMWNTSGCRLVPSETDVAITTCECDHLTIFAALMDPYGSSELNSHKKALEIISIVGCSISLLAVVITVAVNLFFWRVLKCPRVVVLLNLCSAIAVTCVLAILEGLARNSKVGCSVVAALLHYFLLALFSWMLCEGLLHYIKLVRILRGDVADKVKYFFMFGWGFPAIVVTVSLVVTQGNGYGSTTACWLDVKIGLIWAFIGPAVAVIVVNIVVFILVIRQMMGTKYMQNKTQIEKVRAGVKASAAILPLLGITWLFGLLSFSSDTIAFKYIFAIFNSLQGLMIFIFYCVLNRKIKDAVKQWHRKASTGLSSNPNIRPTPKLKDNLQAENMPNQVATKQKSSTIINHNEQLPEILKDTLKLSTFKEQVVVCSVNHAPPEEIVNLSSTSDE